MNILTIGSPFFPQIGGVGTVIFSVNKELAKMGHTCIVLTEKSNNAKKYEIYNGIYVFRYKKIKLFYGLNPFIIQYLKKIMQIYHIDVIHIHGYHSLLSLECAFLLKKEKMPFIFSPHYHGIGHSPVTRALFKFYNSVGKVIFYAAKKIICVSEYEKKIITSDFKYIDSKIQVIPNGVDNIKNKSYKNLKENNSLIKLLYIGRLDRYKGIQYIVKALYVLKKFHRKKVTLTIVGKGPCTTNLKNLAIKLGVLNNISWYAAVTDDQLNELYNTHDILILLSQAEAYGLVVAEALAHGIPCIVAKKAALSEFVNEPGCFGVSYPIDIHELAELIVNIINSDEIKIGPFSKKIQTWSQIAEIYEKLYLEKDDY